MRAVGILAIAMLAIAFVACEEESNGDGASDETPTSSESTSTGETPSNGGTPSMAFAENCQKTGEKTFAAPPEMIIDTNKTYVATIKTAKGDIVAELHSDTPVTTNNFVFLACKGYYDGLTFHRVVADFVIQGGDPTASGSGGPGYQIADEDDGDHVIDTGSLSMAKSGPNTTGSQFFVVTGPRASVQHLDPDFTVFGQVTSGQEVAAQIAQGDKMESVTIEER
jgi:peptidyl-prolyl cis-trans isomerase B (cyclophilin B)